MQVVSSIFLNSLRSDTKSLVTLLEFYKVDASPSPTGEGFNPASSDFLFGISAVNGITFCGRTYTRAVAKNGIGTINRKLGKSMDGFQFQCDSSFALDIEQNPLIGGFEGLICIVRRIDRNTSTVLADSTVRFTGRCDSPDEFDKSSETVKINVKQILNAVEIPIPRRKFTTTDILGRPQSDPEFEGFPFTPRGGAINYSEKVLRSGFGGVLGLHKTVARTLSYSSHDALQEETDVPVVGGRTQMNLINFAYIDRGTFIEGLGFWCDGNENGISDVQNIRSITDGYPLSDQLTYKGLKGGDATDGTVQNKDNPVWVAQGYYSRTVVTRFVAQGTTIQQDDPAPTIAGLVFGQKMLIPDSTGAFTVIDFSDSAVCHALWLLSSIYYFNLPLAWFDFAELLKSYNYGNHVLVDQSNTDAVILNTNQTGIAGVDYKIYKSTAVIAPSYFKNQLGLDTSINANFIEAPYQFYTNSPYNSDDPTGAGTPALPATQLRRRFTCNWNLLEQMKAIDFLYDIIFASSNLYLTQNSKGQFAVKNKRPEDFTFMRTSSAVSAATLDVQNITPFIGYTGKILIGANTPNSEVRSVTGAAYSAAGNSVAISASGGMSASASTLSGASGATPASAVLTVSSVSGTKNYSIAGYNLSYSPAASDTTSTAAGFIAAQINSHELLNKSVKAVWNNNSTVTVQSRLGTLTLDSPLENAHNPAISDPSAAGVTITSGGNLAIGNYQITHTYLTAEGETNPSPITNVNVTSANSRLSVPAITLPSRVLGIRYYFSTETNGVRRRLHTENQGQSFYISSMPLATKRLEPLYNTTSEEIHKVAFVFTDKGNTKTGLVKSNVLKGTFKFPMGSKSQNYNQVEIAYKDSAADYKQSKLIINDDAKQAKVKKNVTLKIDGSAIDNEHQARRIGNSNLAEASDGGFFIELNSDNEAQLLEEGDIICCTDDSGRLVNEPARVEAISDDDNNGYPTVSITARKYRRYYYDDQVQERLVPLPIVQNDAINLEQIAPVIAKAGDATDATVFVEVSGYSTNAKFRKIRVADNNTFTSGLVETVIDASALPNKILDSIEEITRTTGLGTVATKYVEIQHSSNGVQFGALSNVIAITYQNESGDGVPILYPSDSPVVFSAGNTWHVNVKKPLQNGYDARNVQVRLLVPTGFSLTAALSASQAYFYYTGPNALPAPAKVLIGTETIGYDVAFGSSEIDVLHRGIEHSAAAAYASGTVIKPIYQEFAGGDTLIVSVPRTAFDLEIQYRWQNGYRANGSDGWSAWSLSGIAAGSGTGTTPTPPPTPPAVPPTPPAGYEDPYNPGNCFAVLESNPVYVWMGDGSDKLIQDVEIGNLVMCQLNGKIVSRRVTVLFADLTEGFYNLEFADDLIPVTGRHPFAEWENGWKRVAAIEPGDALTGYLKDWQSEKVISNQKVLKTCPTRNHEVAEAQNYFVRSNKTSSWKLVHNRKRDQNLTD